MKRIILLFSIGLLVITLSACKLFSKTDDSELGLLSDVYDDLGVYKGRLKDLTSLEEDGANSELVFLTDYTYKTYSREDLLTAYLKGSPSFVYDDYIEQLLTTKDFISSVMNNIKDDLSTPVGQEFYPIPDNTEVVYKFLYGDEDFIIIDTLDGTHHCIVKIGLTLGNLTYEELHAVFNDDFDPLNEHEIMYSYFSFEENNDAVYINSFGENYDLRYTSLQNGSQFTISYGKNRLELGEETNQMGYVLNNFDSVTNTRAYLQIIDDKIVYETYDVFGEHGLLYRYEDTDVNSDLIKLSVNFIEATNWDHLIVAVDNGGNPGDLDGIYDEAENALYKGRIRFTYAANTAYAAFDQIIEKSELSDENFNLSNYGLIINNEKNSKAAFEAVRITDLNSYKSNFTLPNLNFFADDLAKEMYQYIDQEIIASLFGINETPKGEDVDQFTTCMATYNNAALKFQNIAKTETGVITKTSDTSGKTTFNVTNAEQIALDKTFYFANTFGQRTGSYILRNLEDSLYGFQRSEVVFDYEKVYEEATNDNFEAFLKINTNLYDPLKGVISVKKQSEFVYDLELSYDALGVTTKLVAEEYQLTGLHSSTITATYTFDESCNSYNYIITIEGLSNYDFTDYDVTYIITGKAFIKTFAIPGIFDFPSTYFYLTQNKEENILLEQANQNSRYYVHPGTSYLLIYLEEGSYKARISATSRSVDVAYEDLLGNQISDSDLTTITEDGYYWIRITSKVEQSLSISVDYTYIPIYNNIYLPDSSGTITQTNIDEEIDQIVLPASTEGRLLKITFNQDISEMGIGGFIDMDVVPRDDNFTSCMAIEGQEANPCYFYFEPNKDYVIEVGMPLETTVFSFDYEFVSLPTDYITLTEMNIPDMRDGYTVILSNNEKMVKAYFTIGREDEYTIKIRTIEFGDYNYTIMLYDSDNNLISTEANNFSYLFTEGDYYILYTLFSGNNPIIFEVALE